MDAATGADPTSEQFRQRGVPRCLSISGRAENRADAPADIACLSVICGGA